MLPRVCSAIDFSKSKARTSRQNVILKSVKHSPNGSSRSTASFLFHILTSSVIYYWTDARQHGIYLLNRNTIINQSARVFSLSFFLNMIYMLGPKLSDHTLNKLQKEIDRYL